jgi:hypothetical protein
MLSLQDRTIIEVRQAGGGRRLLRVATSALFAEHAAPGSSTSSPTGPTTSTSS